MKEDKMHYCNNCYDTVRHLFLMEIPISENNFIESDKYKCAQCGYIIVLEIKSNN